MAEDAEEDFTFPATITNPPPCLLESPPLWPPVGRSGKHEEEGGDDQWNFNLFQEFKKRNITFRENFCYVNHDDDEDDDRKEEKMDILWEDLDEKFSRNCGKKKNIAEDLSDNSSPGRDDHVQVCCVKTLKLSKANGQTISWKKTSILVLIRLLLKKSFAMHDSDLSVSTSDFLPFLCNISTLENLDVSNNQLSSIPDSFFTVCGGISGLKLLNFSGNRVIGSFPTLNGFEMLECLDFSRNMLSGEIGMQLDGLDSLKILDLSWNSFTGKIPKNIGKKNLLEKLVLYANIFDGEIPLEITKYKNLSVIDLSLNGLSGSIPREFGEFTKLQTLILSANSLSGEIPTSLSNITTLQRFAANQNNFNGTIPLGITSHLSFLDLSYNNLSGTIPSDLLSGAKLEALDLSFNNLEGPIPAITSTKLFRLRLGSNALNGTIPSESLTSLVKLMYLELVGNNLSGEIPSELGMLRKLALLNLAKNRLRGTLPPSLGNLTNLQVLNLQFNNFVGEIPRQILQLNQLEKLDISRNSLNGSIPMWISRMQGIRTLDLQGNNLRGLIPESIGNLSNLIELQLGNNQLNGRIPSMPEKLQVALNLSYNLFEGPIPVTLSRLQKLEVLDLSNNRFSGEIPSFLTQLGSLTHLLLMNNRLSGEIQKFRKQLLLNATGNNLLVDRRPKYRISFLSTPRRSIFFDSNLGIAFASGFPVGLLISVISIFISRWYYNSIHGNLSTPNSTNVDFKKGMEAAADPSNITLKTSFSTFYKAIMPSGTTYLVKKINHSHRVFQFPRHKDLVEELELLGNMSNSNVMIPIAYVLTPRRAYLFYDFVRGTLHDILHRTMGNSTLDWASRYSIAVGVAQGLAFLHECSSGPIILLDLSTKTILLKSIDEPQISDIELCKLIRPSTCAGSAGYIPPEYGSTKRVTAAGNVYSFGVVLLELLTGKPAVSEGTELAKWVLSSSKCDQILDSSTSETETSTVVRDQMLGVLEVALACISISPEMRPNMVNVVQMLLNTRSN